jgi:transcriptional regulator with XRE-family HTH domain
MLKLTKQRIAAGLSKAALARGASLDQALVSKFESGRVQPYERELRRIAAALRVPAARAATLLDEVSDTSSGAAMPEATQDGSCA